jgi:hypothetical protein
VPIDSEVLNLGSPGVLDSGFTPVGPSEPSPYTIDSSTGGRLPNNSPLDYRQAHEYEHVTGDVVCPRSYGTPVVVNLHQPYTMRKTKWTTSSAGRPPAVPKQGDLGGTQKYVGGTVGVPLPVASGGVNGGFVWTLSGEYLYVAAYPVVLDGTMDVPTGEYPVPIPENEAIKGAMPDATFRDADSFPWPYTSFPKGMVDTSGKLVTKVLSYKDGVLL